MSILSKTSRLKRWTLDFVADKLAILLVLCQQVVDERESRKRVAPSVITPSLEQN